MTNSPKLLVALAGCCLLMAAVIPLQNGFAADRTVILELMVATW